MQDIRELFDTLWRDYSRLNPHAQAIHDLLGARGDTIVNDHIAFRTFGDARVGINVLARAFESFGYESKGSYTFEAKKLRARHYEHADDTLPKVFISELKLDEFSPDLNTIVKSLIAQVPGDAFVRADLPAAGRLWNVTWDEYETLRTESEYAAWLAAHGFCANHFTVFVNALNSFDSLEALNTFLKEEGFALNSSGGEIKGSPKAMLEQSSTLAGEVEVEFTDGTHTIPGCYYEFARRYKDESGNLFRGFIAKSADKIFESTDRR